MGRARRGVKPRYIKAEFVQVGDTIRVARQHVDALIIVQGTVDHYRDNGGMRTLYTKRGIALLHWHLYTRTASARVTLLDVANDPQSAIVEIDEWLS